MWYHSAVKYELEDELKNSKMNYTYKYIREFVARPNRYLILASYPDPCPDLGQYTISSGIEFSNYIKSEGIKNIVQYVPVTKTSVLKLDIGGNVHWGCNTYSRCDIEEVIGESEIVVMCEAFYKLDAETPPDLTYNTLFLLSHFNPSPMSDVVEIGSFNNILESISRSFPASIYSEEKCTAQFINTFLFHPEGKCD